MRKGSRVGSIGLLFVLIIAVALLPSCREKTQINNRVVVTAIGIDDKEGECGVSIQAIEVLKTSGSLTEQEKNATSVYTVEGQSVAGALKAFVADSGRSTYILHNKVIALGLTQIEKAPLETLLDYFIRNHEGRPLVDMVVCRGEAAKLLEVPSESAAIPAEHIARLLEEGYEWGYAVRTRLLDVERALSGMYDAAMPIVRVEGEEEEMSVHLDGTALFRSGAFAGELDESETRGLLYARGDFRQGVYVLPAAGRPEGEKITLSVRNASTKVEIQPQGDAAGYRFRISCEAEILEEFLPGNLSAEEIREAERQLADVIRGETERAIAVSTGYGCDAAGLGRLTQKRCPELIRGREEDWAEQLKDCEFEVEAEVRITKIGAESGEAPRPVV